MSVHWEQLLRNGQLVVKVPEHRMMLERYYSFYKGTSDEQMIASNYPEFYAEMTGTPKAEPVSEPVTETAEAPKKRKGRKPKLSPISND